MYKLEYSIGYVGHLDIQRVLVGRLYGTVQRGNVRHRGNGLDELYQRGRYLFCAKQQIYGVVQCGKYVRGYLDVGQHRYFD
jgi:hypothetical protein